MAKDTRNEIRLLLADREAPFYEAKYHAVQYVFPILILILGIFMIFIPNDLYIHFPKKTQEFILDSIQTIKEVHAGLLFILAGVGLFIKARYARKHYIHLITNYRLLEKIGKSEKKIRSIPLFRVKEIRVEASIFQKLIGVGKVIIKDKETDKEVFLEDISDPKKYKLAFKQAQDRFMETSVKAFKEGVYHENKRLR